MDIKITSVSYSRLFNLGDYENEKIGVSAAVEEGQTPEAVLEAAKAWVHQRGNEYRGLREKIDRLEERLYEYDRLKRRARSAFERSLDKLKEIVAVLEAHGVTVDVDLSRFEVSEDVEQEEDANEEAF